MATILNFFACLGDFLERHDGAITAVATAVIAIFTIVLARVTGRQARLTKEAFVDDKRAFVFAVGISPQYDPEPVAGFYNWRFRPQWRNSGDTPTQGLRLHTDCELRNTPLPPGFRFDQATTNIGPSLLAPKIELSGGPAPAPPVAAITPQDILDVQFGRKFLYIWGWATYFDVFPGTREHLTRFCWLLNCAGDPKTFDPNARGAHPTPGTMLFTFTQHSEGNCADNECAH